MKLGLIRRHILTKLEHYPTQLLTNAHIFELLFKEASGFSGTLRSGKSLPVSYSNLALSDTETKTLAALWNAKSPVSILPKEVLSEENLGNLIQKLYVKHRGSFTDLGGLFRGFDPEEVAKAILQLPIWETTPIRGIVFHDKSDQKWVWIREEKVGVPFKNWPLKKEPIGKARLKKNQMIAYWAQKHTTGADFKLSPLMTSIVTISQHTMMRDLLQAVWRLRELDRGQKVEFRILPEDADIMAAILKSARIPMKDPKNPSLADLFRFVKYNEIARQKDDNWRALRFNFKNALLKFWWPHILNEPNETTGKVIDELFFQKNRWTRPISMEKGKNRAIRKLRS